MNQFRDISGLHQKFSVFEESTMEIPLEVLRSLGELKEEKSKQRVDAIASEIVHCFRFFTGRDMLALDEISSYSS